MNRSRGSGRLETLVSSGEPVVDMTAVLDAPLKDAVIGAERGQGFGVEGESIGEDEKGLVMEEIANNSLDPTEVLVAPSVQEEVDDDVSSALMTPFSPILPQHSSINTGSKVGGDSGVLRGSSFGVQNTGIEERDRSTSVHTTSLLPYSLRSAKLLANKPQLLGRSGSASVSTSPGGSLNGLQQKKKLSTTKTKPAFVNKLWSMVNDPANQTLIHWSDGGKSFIVTQREQFVHEILPKYFKHSNFASFVRQLNMYGWHKVQDVKSGSIQSNSDDRWEFANDNFQRGREDLLTNILRQKPSGSHGKDANSGLSVNNTNLGAILVSNGEEVDLGILLTELETVKYNQMAIAEDLRRISKDNEMLWKENMLARERHQNQQQALEKIVKFLSSLYGSNTTRLLSDNLFHDHQQPTVNINNQTTAMAVSPLQMPDGLDNSIIGAGDSNMMTIPVPHRHQRPRLLLKQRSASSSSSSGVAEWIKESPAEELQGSTTQHPSSGMTPHPIIEEQIEPVHEVPSENALSTEDNHTSFFNDLHNNIERQGESIQEIQDWINRLSPNEHNDSPDDHRMARFDPQEYLSATTPQLYNSPMGTLTGQKRPLEEDAEEIYGASPSISKPSSDTMTATETDPHSSHNSNSNRNKKAKDFSGRL